MPLRHTREAQQPILCKEGHSNPAVALSYDDNHQQEPLSTSSCSPRLPHRTDPPFVEPGQLLPSRMMNTTKNHPPSKGVERCCLPGTAGCRCVSYLGRVTIRRLGGARINPMTSSNLLRTKKKENRKNKKNKPASASARTLPVAPRTCCCGRVYSPKSGGGEYEQDGPKHTQIGKWRLGQRARSQPRHCRDHRCRFAACRFSTALHNLLLRLLARLQIHNGSGPNLEGPKEQERRRE